MSRAPFVLVFVLVAACGSGSGDDGGDDTTVTRDAGVAVGEICGVPGEPTGSDCAGFDECGVRNVTQAFNCERCPQEAVDKLCSAGSCVPYQRDATIQVGFNVFEHGAGGNSFVFAVLDPMGADGTRITCEGLLASCTLEDNFNLNVMRVQVAGAGTASGFEQNQAYRGLVNAASGDGLLALLRIHVEGRGNGAVLAKGCAVVPSVAAGETAQVIVDLVAP